MIWILIYFNKIKKDPDRFLYLNEDYQQEFVKIGLPCYSKHSIIFTENEIKKQVEYNSIMSLRPWKALFEKQILNQNRIFFYNSNKELVDITTITRHQEIKNLAEIVIK